MTQKRRRHEDREWDKGWEEYTIGLLLTVEGSEDLKKVERTFYSKEDRDNYLKRQINRGVVYDIIYTAEIFLGGKGNPAVPPLDPEEEAFLLASAWNTVPSVSEDEVHVV